MIYIEREMPLKQQVTFCFLVTKDLVKETVWRKWLDKLAQLNFNFQVVTHCSPNFTKNITSDWLRQTLLPEKYLCETGWGWVMKATLALYKYATEQAPADWYTLHSETCVPFVTPEKFIELYTTYKQNTFISYCKAWPGILQCKRANLHLLPPEYHLVHQNWVILCHEDLSQMLHLAQVDRKLTTTLMTGHVADESFIAVFLYKINNFKNVLNKLTTIADWKRTPNGNNPYTFNSWTETDQTIVAELGKDRTKNEYMFLRKIGPAFPEKVLYQLLNLS